MFGESTIQPILDGNFKSHSEWLIWMRVTPILLHCLCKERVIATQAIDGNISQHTFYCDNTNMSSDALHVFISYFYQHFWGGKTNNQNMKNFKCHKSFFNPFAVTQLRLIRRVLLKGDISKQNINKHPFQL